MDAQNCYTVRGRAGAVTAAHAMTDTYWQRVSTDAGWARRIVLTDENGERRSAPAVLRYVNSRPERGGVLRALYGASLDCPQGARYVRASLCADETEAGEMSRAAIDYTSAGETVEVTVLVCLSTQWEENITFCEGDNRFVRRLLGCGTDGALEIAWGNCEYPARPCTRSDMLVAYPAQGEVFADKTGIDVVRTAATYGKELLLTDGGQAVMRAVRPFEYNVRIITENIGRQSAVLVTDNFPEQVYNAFVGGDSVLGLETQYIYDRVLSVHADEGVYVGVEGEVKSDPGEEYLAVITASYAEVYEVDVDDRKRLLRVPRSTEYVEICRGGSLVLWGSTQVTIYERDDSGAYDSFSVALPCGEERIVQREGSRYHLAYRQGNNFYRYVLSRRTNLLRLQLSYVDSDAFMLSKCGDAIAYGDGSVHVVTTSVDMTEEYRSNTISKYTARQIAGYGDCFSVCVENGKTISYDFIHGSTQQLVGSGYKTTGRLTYNGNRMYIYNYYNGQSILSGEHSLKSVTSACIAGRGLFVIDGGKLRAYFCSGYVMAVRRPVTEIGYVFTASVRERIYLGEEKGVTFRIASESG